MTMGNVESHFEVCAAHAVNFTKAGTYQLGNAERIIRVGHEITKRKPGF
jgi:hypothetical protein